MVGVALCYDTTEGVGEMSSSESCGRLLGGRSMVSAPTPNLWMSLGKRMEMSEVLFRPRCRMIMLPMHAHKCCVERGDSRLEILALSNCALALRQRASDVLHHGEGWYPFLSPVLLSVRLLCSLSAYDA